jgi:D-alanyl-D-alanine carboxypeptidase
MQIEQYQERIQMELARLGIPLELIAQKGLPFYPEAQDLITADTGTDGQDYLMTPDTARAWTAMKLAARQENIVLEVVSSFRTIERQIAIIQNKLNRNMPIEKILTLSAPPGYSEHHTGRAIDINTPGCVATEAEFEDTAAFRWLQQRAGDFGFTLSYPRGNALGFIYEPWHWCYQADESSC